MMIGRSTHTMSSSHSRQRTMLSLRIGSDSRSLDTMHSAYVRRTCKHVRGWLAYNEPNAVCVHLGLNCKSRLTQ